MEVHGAPLPTLNFGGADPYEVHGALFEARAPAPHPLDHLLTQPAAARSVEHSFHRAARRPDGRSASGAGDSAPSNPAFNDSPASARALPAPICEPRANPDSCLPPVPAGGHPGLRAARRTAGRGEPSAGVPVPSDARLCVAALAARGVAGPTAVVGGCTHQSCSCTLCRVRAGRSM